MSKVKQALLVVKIVIAVAACIVGYIFYQNYTASQQKIEEQKKIDKLYNDNKWAEAVEEYKNFIQKYPEKKALVNSKLGTSLQNLGNEKSIQAMAIPKTDSGKKQAANREVIKLMEEAKEYDDLNEMSYVVLCDSYIECKEYDKAKGLIKEAKSRTGIQPSRFGVQERQIEQALKKK